MQWNWDHIRFFLALEEHGTLSLAAGSLGVSHTTVQRRIQQFEFQLQTQLFERKSDRYVLTAAGKALHVEAVKMQGTLSTISRKIAGTDNKLAGEVTITSTDTLARYLLPKLLAKLNRKYPDICFSLSMVNKLSNIDDREADIAIRTGKAPPDNLIGRKVGEIRFIAVASRDYIKRNKLSTFPRKCDEHSFVVLDPTYSSASFYQWLEGRLTQNSKRTVVNNFLCAAALAREGMGITVLPSYMLKKDSALVALQTVNRITRNDVWVLSHADLRGTEKIRVVRQFFYDELPKLLSA